MKSINRKTPKEQAEFLAKMFNNLRGYDHIHWTVMNNKSEKRPSWLGTTTSDGSTEVKYFIFGRNCRGYHDSLYGPVTQEEFNEITKTFTQFQ